MIKNKFTIPALVFLLYITACSNSESSRKFYMGFTPWPYAATTAAVAEVYNFINTEGDLIAHHFQQGIPFTAPDTLDFSTYDINVRNEINGRISDTAGGKVIYLAIDCLNADRSGLTDIWGSSPNMTRTGTSWETARFSDAAVIEAYTEFSIAVIEKFRLDYGRLPSYFNYAPEISDLMVNSPAEYSDFIIFAQTVYTSVKAAYPSVKLMVSIALKSPGSAEMITAKNGFVQIRNYVDVAGISTYGYAFYSHAGKGNPDNLPVDWLTQIKNIAPGKPYAVTETGWIAENLSIPAYSLSVFSNESYQDNYINKLLNECQNDINSEAVILFTAYDYDDLWANTLGSDDISKIWKDTGLINESFRERNALSTWRQWKKIKKQ